MLSFLIQSNYSCSYLILYLKYYILLLFLKSCVYFRPYKLNVPVFPVYITVKISLAFLFQSFSMQVGVGRLPR